MKFYLLFVYLLNYLSDNEQQATQIILPTYLIQCRGNYQIGDFITIVRSIVSKEYDYERNYYDVMLEAKYLAKWLCGAELEDKAEETENEIQNKIDQHLELPSDISRRVTINDNTENAITKSDEIVTPEFCPLGYHIFKSRGNTSCQPNSCECLEGFAENFQKWSSNENFICETHNSISCSVCDEYGYKLDDSDSKERKCQQTGNICACENGIPAIGNDSCPINGQNLCIDCNPGYHMVSSRGRKSCQPNRCICDYGYLDGYKNWQTTGGDSESFLCKVDKSVGCIKCDEGYGLVEKNGVGSCV